MADGEQDGSSTVIGLHPTPLVDEGAAGTIDEPEDLDLTSIIERAYLIGIGLASLTSTAVVDAVARSVDPRISGVDGHSPGMPAMAGAAFGAAAHAGALAVRAGLTAVRTIGGLAWVVVGSLVGADRTRWLQDQVAEVDERGQRECGEAELAAIAFADVLIPAIVDAVTARLDIQGATSPEAVDTIRLRGIGADRFVTRVTDPGLSREGDDAPPPAPDGAGGRT
jgi:hypothetical protein